MKHGVWGWVRGAVLATTAIGTAAGCRPDRGDWSKPPSAPADSGAALVLLGDAGGSTRHAERTAARLDAVLQAEDAAGHHPVVVWLGDNVLPDGYKRRCPAVAGSKAGIARAFARPGSAQIAAAVGRHRRRGHPAYAVAGEQDWRCGLAAAQRQADDSGPNPWLMPAPHYVVRVGGDGQTRVASRCRGTACEIDEPGPGDIADLVLVDTTAWVHPQWVGNATADARVERLDALLRALDDSGSALPRLLVTHFPVEAAGYHGLGGGRPDATFHSAPPRLQTQLLAGAYAGVLSGHDRSLYAAADLSDAIKRADRAWLTAPVFEVVSGSATLPDAYSPRVARRIRWYQSSALTPDVYTRRPGFAVVHVTKTKAHTVLHAYRSGRWQTAELTAPMRPAPHPVETGSPSMAPCLDCPIRDGQQRP